MKKADVYCMYLGSNCGIKSNKNVFVSNTDDYDLAYDGFFCVTASFQ